MTLTQSALLAAILDEPDCDLHRMAMADWLEEQGEGERAEFIRVQLRLAKLPHCVRRPMLDLGPNWPPCGRCTYCRLLSRSEELLGPRERVPTASHPYYEYHCLSPVHENWASFDRLHLYYHRGFVEAIVCDWAWWEQHHAEVLGQQPVKKLYLTGDPPAYLNAGIFLYEKPDSLLRARWPRLEFVLPDQAGVT